MITLTLRTDKPEAELGLYDGTNKIAYERWEAHRRLAETLHQKIDALLKTKSYAWDSIGSIIVFEGPGSFTGLRIGIATANALSYALNVPVVGGQDAAWIADGLMKLADNENAKVVLPFYGSEAHITMQKK